MWLCCTKKWAWMRRHDCRNEDYYGAISVLDVRRERYEGTSGCASGKQRTGRVAEKRPRLVIMEGKVFVKGQREDKAGSMFDEAAPIEIHGQKLRYVSRGGLKLEKAVAHFDLELEGKICMDVGSSTGGFTDCMLQNGAVKVYAVDVGTNQLDWKLRSDPQGGLHGEDQYPLSDCRIRSRSVLQFASIDVAFISLTKVLLPVRELLKR